MQPNDAYATEAVPVPSDEPKFKPTTVTELPPVHGRLGPIAESTGESKLKMPMAVPQRAALATTKVSTAAATTPDTATRFESTQQQGGKSPAARAAPVHFMAVTEVQDALEQQLPRLKQALPLASAAPKFKPLSETDESADSGMFMLNPKSDTTGLS